MQVHLRDEGPRDDPTPIVLIHGTSASLHTWEGWVAALKDDRRVITFDLPGFGLTGPSPDGDYTIAAYVRFVGGGISLGGNIAWATAHAMPDRVYTLVLVDSGGYPFVSSSVPIGFRVAQIPVVNHFLEYVTPRSLVAASVRYSVIGNVSSLAAMGPPSCIGLIFTPTRDGSTSSSTASTTSNRMRARFSIEPPYSSVRRLVTRFKN